MGVALVTGISGQDGSYLCEQLLADGTQVHGMLRPEEQTDPGAPLADPRVTLHRADLADADSLQGMVTDVAPDEIYHLAGISSVAQSWREPAETGQISGLAVVHLLEAAHSVQEQTGRPVRFLQASSAEMFGSPIDVPQTESTVLRPTSPYGAAKTFAHHMCDVYRARDLHTAACILYNHESPRRPVTFVTRKITHGVAQIAAGKAKQLTLGNLDVRRDWGWAPDYVRAMVLAVRHDQPGDYVIATGETHSVRDFVAAAFARAGVADWQDLVAVDPAFARPVDAPELRGDASRARDELGWTPTVAFPEVVARMVDHDMSEQE